MNLNEEIKKLGDRLASGEIDQEEYEFERQRLLKDMNDSSAEQQVVRDDAEENDDKAQQTQNVSNDGPVNPLVASSPIDAGRTDDEEKPNESFSSRLISRLGGKKRAAIIAFLVVAVIFCLPSIFPQWFCSHEAWADATCTEPRTCKNCGKTDGQPLGHDWADATCTESKTCARCGATDGNPLGHEPGKWTTKADYVKATTKEVQKCSRCGEIIDTRNESKMTSFVGDGFFTISPSDLIKRMNEEFSDLPGYKTMSADSDLDSSGMRLGLRIKKGSKSVGIGGFYSDSSTQLLFSNLGAENSFKNVVMYFGSSSDYVAPTAVATIQAIDPSLSFSDAKAVATDCAGKAIVKNGITYAVLYSSDGYWMSARID